MTDGVFENLEDGDYSFVYMNVDDGADNSVLSVEDFEGSKQLKVDVQDNTLVPKVWFDLYKMADKATVAKINTIEFDVTLAPKEAGGTVGWAGGAIGSAGSFPDQTNPDWSQTDWSCTDENAYNPDGIAKCHVEKKFLLPTSKYTEASENPFFGIMRWAAESPYVMYIDNIVLYDESGTALPLTGSAAPAGDSTTSSAGTGNAAAASIAAVMALAGTVAIVAKKRK